MTIRSVVAELERISRRDQTMEPAVQKSKVVPGTRFRITQPTYLHQQPQMEGSGFKVKAPAGYEVEATGKIHQNMVEVALAVASSKVPAQIRNKTWWVDVDSLGRALQSSVAAPVAARRVMTAQPKYTRFAVARVHGPYSAGNSQFWILKSTDNKYYKAADEPEDYGQGGGWPVTKADVTRWISNMEQDAKFLKQVVLPAVTE